MIKDEFERYLETVVCNETLVNEAMNYSLLAKSKRLRPLLLLNLLKDFSCDYKLAFPVAASIEMIHTYSLIHDDLPAFDNDDYRRGQLTCHKKYNEFIAILAGDGLLTDSFLQVNKTNYSSEIKNKLIYELASAASSYGMIKGQYLDMTYEDKSVPLEALLEMDNLKTGRMITLPLVCACLIASKEELINDFKEIGKDLGIAFQIQDDILDITGNLEELGKSSSDIDNSKSTYVSLLSLHQAKAYVDQLFQRIYDYLPDYCVNTKELIKKLENRNW